MAEKYGVPHSVYMDWEPADQAKAIAFLFHQGEKCSLCGTAEWEWDPEQGGSRFAYEPVEKVCMGCYKKHGMGSDAPGTSVTLERTGTRASARRFLSAQEKQQRRREARDD